MTQRLLSLFYGLRIHSCVTYAYYHTNLEATKIRDWLHYGTAAVKLILC